MKVRLWGTRGSLGAAGHDTVDYGGNTSCVEVRSAGGSRLVLDAGSGARQLGDSIGQGGEVHVLLTHLHMDHIQGLGFFRPLFDPQTTVHLWGPASASWGLQERLSRYLSPPLFPVHLRDLPNVQVHDVVPGPFEVGPFEVEAAYVCHPGLTLGYRIAHDESVLSYLPDHEPALGAVNFPDDPTWTSGYALAHAADVLIHDAQYTGDEYLAHLGWGHSTIDQAVAFAELAEAKTLLTFHHDPARGDAELDRLAARSDEAERRLAVVYGREGAELDVASGNGWLP